MVSLRLSRSRSGSNSTVPDEGGEDFVFVQEDELGPPLASKSASSSTSSLAGTDTEDITITASRSLEDSKGKGRSIDDLRILAMSTHMTELSYNISDIQTRIFEIQELRHQSHAAQDNSSSSTSVIDQALMNLDERLEAVNRGMKSLNDSLEPLLSKTPRPSEEDEDMNEAAILLRKHAALVSEWESVQDDTEVLREELKEDKWLTVFRTVSEQADGMMTSLENAVKRCQDFIWRVHRKAHSEDSVSSLSHSPSRKPSTPTYDNFCNLLESYEAKKKHYMPATSKVLSIIDKGVQDRVTKNGECLRRHAEAMQRWKTLRDRVTRTDNELENVRRVLLIRETESSETASVISEKTSRSSGVKMNGHLATPPSSESSRGRNTHASTLLRSMSPLRKLARRIGKVGRTPSSSSNKSSARAPSSDPVKTLRHRQSLFPLRDSINTKDVTPDRPTHKHSQSFTPESPLSRKTGDHLNANLKFNPPKWNSSTKVEEESMKLPKTPSRRPSATNLRGSYSNPPPVTSSQHRRSASRSSFTSSRPWSPITASAATTRSSISRPPSRAQSPNSSPRYRPKTPSHIPTPVFWKGTSASSEASFDESSQTSVSLMQRLSSAASSVMSPSTSSTLASSTFSARAKTPLGGHVPHPRPPSRSMIPVPKFQISAASRPPSAMSDYDRPGTSMSLRSSAHDHQNAGTTLRSRRSAVPLTMDSSPSNGTPSSVRRQTRLPPSSFRDSSAARPPSRSGNNTPGPEAFSLQTYVPTSTKDPLDIEVANVANAIPHSLLIERLDPPLRTLPKEGEEIKAQYAFTNQLARKVVTCRLVTMSRSSVTTKKVMCRVGGGWQDLQLYILNRQNGNY